MVPNAYEIAINKGIGLRKPVREILNDALEALAQTRKMKRFAVANDLPLGTIYHINIHKDLSPTLLTTEQIFEAMGYRLTLEAIK